MKPNQNTGDVPMRVVPTFIQASNTDYPLMLLWFVPMFLWILWVNYLFTDGINMPWWFPSLVTVLFAPFVYRRYQYIKRIFVHGIYSEGTFTFIYLVWYSTSVRYTYKGKGIYVTDGSAKCRST